MINKRLAAEIRHWMRSIRAVAAGRGGPDAVHQLRVVTRRCREGMSLFGYKSAPLACFSHALGRARDVEMLWQRLAAEKNSSPRRRRLRRLLKNRRGTLLRELSRRLRSRGVRRLAEGLRKISRENFSTGKNGKKAEDMARKGLRKAYRGLRELWKKRPKRPEPAYLHSLRRAIRRLRYVAELTEPFTGKGLSKQAIAWQRRLGECRDAVIAQKLLREFKEKEARPLAREYERMEKETADRFWKKWRHGGRRKLERRTKSVIRTVRG